MRLLIILALASCLPVFGAGKKKKNDELPTQVLELPKELPSAIVADAHRLVFQTSPLSSKGLLSAQVREALKYLMHANRGATIVRLRAFVAGTGDMRRVQTIVSEEFTDKKLALPVLTTVQAGALPMEGAQVVLESIAVDRRDTTPQGIALYSGQAETSAEYTPLIAGLAAKAIAKLAAVAREAGTPAQDMLRVTCFATSLDDAAQVHRDLEAAFPGASINLVQLQRGPVRSLVECEGVARLSTAPAEPIAFFNPQGATAVANYSQVALVGAARLVFSGAQLGFGQTEPDVKLAYQRLGKNIEQAGGSYRSLALITTYTLSPAITEQIRKVRFQFLDAAKPPASTLLSFESLPSIDATFALDVVAAAL